VNLKNHYNLFPFCRTLMGPETWYRILAESNTGLAADKIPDYLKDKQQEFAFPEYLPDLAAAELALENTRATSPKIPAEVRKITLNPTLQVLHLPWTLSCVFKKRPSFPEKKEEWLLIWWNPRQNRARVQSASPEDLLILKMVAEDISPETAGEMGNLTPGRLRALLLKASRKGFLLAPPSRIRREPDFYVSGDSIPDRFLTAGSFTLQWHITNACDLHCRHCYDRSRRSQLEIEQGYGILDDLDAFCHSKGVTGNVCFTGGNPFLHPRFDLLYRRAHELGFNLSILGNPVPRDRVEQILEIRKPSFFQVSLEGLPEHNDWIRGKGEFNRVIEFLGVLRDLKIESGVMLTLTRDNMQQILPLAERLRGHTDTFTFNRLSPVGEGAHLALPDPKDYEAFLCRYAEAARSLPHVGIKDNLMNILFDREERSLFGGCTGFGCGAAFNFLAVLPDGEVHACRKFPSPVGNIFEKTLETIYDSPEANIYRKGTEACRDCVLRPVCGSCLAVVQGMGGKLFRDRDPFCFYKRQQG
jgi:selenobiotic family peptide radical SAM maturase